jgi:F0F1-type ATP synthase membrane subunit b/b'
MDKLQSIREHMKVVGRDGLHVGTVDRIEGDHLKLSRSDTPDGDTARHRYLPLTLVDTVQGERVTLTVTASGARHAAKPEGGSARRQVSDDVRDGLATAKAGVEEFAEDVKNKALDVAGAASVEGAELLGAAQTRAESLAEEGKAVGAEQISGVAKAIRTAADDLERSSPEIAQHVRSAATSVEGISAALRDRSAGQLLQDLTDFARRQPAAFFGVAVVTGFALARFAKSSSERLSGPSVQQSDFAPTGNSAPGWNLSENRAGPTPATLAAATLGGAAAHRSGQAAPSTMATASTEKRTPQQGAASAGPRVSRSSPTPNERSASPL